MLSGVWLSSSKRFIYLLFISERLRGFSMCPYPVMTTFKKLCCSKNAVSLKSSPEFRGRRKDL